MQVLFCFLVLGFGLVLVFFSEAQTSKILYLFLVCLFFGWDKLYAVIFLSWAGMGKYPNCSGQNLEL